MNSSLARLVLATALVSAFVAGPALACQDGSPSPRPKLPLARTTGSQCGLLLAQIRDVHQMHPEACREPGSRGDPAFCRLVELGDPATACLLDKVTDTTRMPDPGCPGMSGDRYAVGDLAYVTLVSLHGLEWNAPFPAAVRADIRRKGAYAYYDYVNGDPHARRHLRDSLARQLRARKPPHAGR
jgi:hypothetical protein